jgi:hypothetical protein
VPPAKERMEAMKQRRDGGKEREGVRREKRERRK